MLNLGTVRPGATIRIPFSTFDKDDGSSVTMTSYAAADILVYKDGSTTERASTSGFTATTDFDGKTGKHLAIIDLSDDTTADFYKAGSEYLVAIDAVTVDGVTTGGWIARFGIGYGAASLDTSIATLSTQTSFTLTSGPAEDDALNGHWAIIHDKASAVQRATVLILDYTGSTKTVTLAAGATFTVAAGDNISVMDLAPLQPATLGRTVVVDAAGLVDANAVKLGPSGSGTAQTARDIGASVLLSNGTGTGQLDFTSGVVKANVTQFGGSAGTFSGGRPEVNSTHLGGTSQTGRDIGASVLLSNGTGTGQVKLASGYVAMTWADIAAPTTVVNLSGTTVKTATDVETDTQDIQGRLPAALVSGRIDASVGAMAANTLTASALATDAVTEIQSGLALATDLATVAGYVDTEVAAIKAKTDNLPSDPADASDIAASFASAAATLSNIATVTANLQTTLQPAGGSPGDYEFTADALRHAPTGAAGAGGPSVADIVDAVLDEALADHLLTGSVGLALYSADQRGERTVVRGTADSGATTTSLPTSAFSPAGAAADQFKGRIVVFDNDTTTAALRGEATDITASSNSATPTLTVTALTTAPAAGDTFSVL